MNKLDERQLSARAAFEILCHEEFTVVDADNDRLRSAVQIVVPIKGRRNNRRTWLELPPEIGGNRG